MKKVRINDGSAWPDPTDEKYDNLVYRLCRTQSVFTLSEQQSIASVMEAYYALILHPAFTLKKVSAKISGIRKKIKMPRQRITGAV
jgi:hypothetical protein